MIPNTSRLLSAPGTNRFNSASLLFLKKFAPISVFLVLFSTATFALPDDREQILYLRAQSADISQKKHRGVYSGNVELDQGSTHLRAAKAITEGNSDNKLVKAIAYGDETSQAHFWSLMAADKPELHAFADMIYYYPEKNIIELVGDAKVIQGKNTFTAPTIIYNTEKQRVVTEPSGKQRTHITIYPEKKNE